jgi:hypothetical protein
MSYEQANEWFKREHMEWHVANAAAISAAICRRLGCGRIWSRIIRVYADVAA